MNGAVFALSKSYFMLIFIKTNQQRAKSLPLLKISQSFFELFILSFGKGMTILVPLKAEVSNRGFSPNCIQSCSTTTRPSSVFYSKVWLFISTPSSSTMNINYPLGSEPNDKFFDNIYIEGKSIFQKK